MAEIKDKQKIDPGSIHEGHRKRMRERYAETGFEGFSDYNALEMLLYYAIPRKDTNELAHTIINDLGSFAAVFEASKEELMQVKGVNEHTATLISLVTQVNKRYLESKCAKSTKISSSAEAGNYFIAKFAYEVNECAYAMLLDGKGKLIVCRKISQGVVNGTDIGIRSLCELALKFRATSVIVAHNHPTGVLMPSAEDEHCTGMIKKALDVIGITLSDHIIVAGEKYISLSRLGMM